jgi:hypothetical protein
MSMGSPYALVDGHTLSLDAPARVIAARAYVPLRFVAQAMGAVVGYDARENLVRVVTPEKVGRGATPAPDRDVNPYPLPSIDPGLPDAPPFQGSYQFYVSGPRVYYAGDWMHFTLLAPPGGSGQLDLCGLGMRYSLWNHGSGSVYEATVPAPSGYWISSCPVTAMYTAWNGTRYYVPTTVVVSIFTRAQHARATPSPAPHPTPHQIPHPGGPKRIEPTPAPTPAPVPRAAATPHAATTPRPAQTPVPQRTARPVPRPRQTP